MTRMLAVIVTGAAVLTLGASPARASAAHDLFEESYDGSFHLSADENPCGSWGATLGEVRTGAYRMVTAPGGQVGGEVHLNGAVDGRVALVPDDPALPTYAGSYREKVNGILSGVDENGDDVMRVSQYRLRVPLSTPEGDRLVLTMSGKATFDAQGTMRVSRDVISCS